MAITPQKGYIVDPNNKNAVIKDPGVAPNPFAPNTGSSIAYGAVNTQPVGVKASAPEQNITAPTYTIPSSQQAPMSAPTPPVQQNTQNTQQVPQQSQAFSAPQNSGLYGQLLSALATNYSQPSPAYTQAQADYTKSVGALSDFNQKLAAANANIEQTPIPLEFQQGREQVLARQAASQQAALQGAVNQQQAALGFANTQQSQQQQALATALGAAAPILSQYGQANYNPLSGGTGGDMTQVLQQYAQGLQNGTLAYNSIPSSITGNSVLNAQLLQAAGPNFNLNQSLGSSAAQQSNAALSGTATPTAYNSIYQKALGDYQNLQQNVQQVDAFGTLLTGNMLQGGINPSNVKFANQTLAQVRNQLSSEAQAQYDTTLAALRSKISGMLAIGGSETPTAITADAQKILDGSLPLSQLSGVLARISQEGQILLQSQAQKVNTAKTGIGSSPSPQPTGSSIYSF